MKRKFLLPVLLLVLACLDGYLLSKASWVGRVGISLFYQQYKFLKIWWQAGLLVLIIWMLLYFLQEWLQRKLLSAKAKWIHVGGIAVALIGLYFTYQDFQHNTAHRWLGTRFYLGGYIFWLGWIIVGVFYLAERKKTAVLAD